MIKYKAMDNDQRSTPVDLKESLNDELQAELFVKGIINPNIVAKKEDFEQILTDIRFIKNRYGIRPKMHDMKSSDQQGITAEQMDLKDAVKAVKIFREELAKYPPEMIKEAGITQFRIMEEINLNSGPPSLITLGVTYESGDVYVANGDDDMVYRETIHHELWHRFDYQRYQFEDTKPYLEWIDIILDAKIDSDWENVSEYNGDDWVNSPDERPTGFVNKYSTKSPKEDRASIAQLLMTQPAVLSDMCKEDRVLNKKVRMLKRLYYRDSHHIMNKKYFSDLAKDDVKEDYWTKKKG